MMPPRIPAASTTGSSRRSSSIAVRRSLWPTINYGLSKFIDLNYDISIIKYQNVRILGICKSYAIT
jgi:hypothetical protein